MTPYTRLSHSCTPRLDATRKRTEHQRGHVLEIAALHQKLPRLPHGEVRLGPLQVFHQRGVEPPVGIFLVPGGEGGEWGCEHTRREQDKKGGFLTPPPTATTNHRQATQNIVTSTHIHTYPASASRCTATEQCL